MIVVIATGGTIASRPGREGVVASMSGDDLIAAVPELSEEGPLEVVDLMRVNAFALSVEQVFEIAGAARDAAARPEVAGVVVTHGTDTMEESAYLTDLLHAGPEPIVFTGAQRHAGMTGGDGPANLLNAVRIARAPESRDLGAVIALEGTIEAAREATKVDSWALRAFGSPGAGPLGDIGADGVRVRRRRSRPAGFPDLDTLEPSVALIRLVVGIGGELIRSAMSAGARGLVLEAFGVGNANPDVVAAVAEAVEAGVVVLVTSRCHAGAVAPLYGNGGGHDLALAGAVPAGDLRGPKARMLLMAALGAARGRPGRAVELARLHFT
ncbi:MAG: asparaginase [Solirubrobacterales bacterium]|nr:asparaginase [Solirubrobacterales bacterium]